MSRTYEIRDPVHGFVQLNELEWDVINQPAFQRLRRIRQLAWTDMVYPAAMHTRFEHSVGVMHVATRLYDAIVKRSGEILRSDYGFEDSGLDRQRQVIRLSALLHDIGHGPFSHAAEDLFPINPGSRKRYEHEDYSAAIVLTGLKDVIESNSLNKRNFGISVSEVNQIFSNEAPALKNLVWKEIVSGQMDADRMDYLLRDSYHAGVSYGKYDLDRVVNTVRLCEEPGSTGHRIGIGEDGMHAVEGLLIARYMMFTQLYFHKTRTIYDYHLTECLQELLRGSHGLFPAPQKVKSYLEWDDWKVLGGIAIDKGGAHGKILKNRTHHRMVYETSESPLDNELEEAEQIAAALSGLECIPRDAKKSWYKFQREEIFVQSSSGTSQKVVPLSTLSSVVKGLATVNQRRLYVPLQKREEAKKIISNTKGAQT